jgi:hypothetical protein
MFIYKDSDERKEAKQDPLPRVRGGLKFKRGGAL